MGFQGVARQLLARGGRAVVVPVVLTLIGGFWLLAPVGAAPSDVTSVSVSPSSDTNAVNTVHQMTATVAPVEAGVPVRFRVFSGPNAGDTGAAATGADGKASLSYLGDGGLGTDTILVWVDVDSDANTDPGEPLAVATSTWTSGVVTSLTLNPITDTNPLNTLHTLTATIAPVESGVLIRFKVMSGPNAGSTDVALTNASGQASYAYTGTGGAGIDLIAAWADLDVDGVMDAGEASATATKAWTAAAVGTITLTPVTDTNPVNTSHTVTATLSPVTSGTLVRFRVNSGPNIGDTGSGTTDANGKTTFTYTGDGGVGGDVVIGWVDTDLDAVLDADEPVAVAAKFWVAGAVTGIALSPTSDTNPVGTTHSVTATVSPVQSGVLTRFKVTSGPNTGESGNATTGAAGTATFSYLGDGGVGTDVILAWADLDSDGVVDSGEPQATAVKLWTTTTITGLTLSPSSDENPVGTKHSLSATVNPKVAGVQVRMEVLAGPNIGKTDSDHTNSSGVAHLSYVGTGGVGTDLIFAWVDADNDGQVDAGEQQATASKTWVAAAPGASGNDDALEVCENLDGSEHPSLRSLCDALITGVVSDHAREVIAGIILRKAEWAFPGWNGHCRDRGEGRGRGHDRHGDDDRCGGDHDDHRGWSRGKSEGQHGDDDDD